MKTIIRITATKVADLKAGDTIVAEQNVDIILPTKDENLFEATQTKTVRYFTITEALPVNKGKKVTLTYVDHVTGQDNTEIMEPDATVQRYTIVPPEQLEEKQEQPEEKQEQPEEKQEQQKDESK